MLLVDPELEDALADVECEMKWTIGDESDAILMKFDTEPMPWEGDEDATATINYTSGTTARPKGVQLTHRNVWLNATTFGWHMGVSDRDVYLHTLPQFHCNGWGMLYAVTGMGGKHVIQRKIDGAEILRRVESHGVTLMCGAPAVLNMILDAAADWDGPIPGSGRVRIVVAGAPPPTRTIERTETELGWEFVQIYGLTETAPLLTINRNRSEWDDLSPAERAVKLNRAGAPAIGCQMAVDAEGEILARSNVVMAGYWEQPDQTDLAIRDGFFHTGDGGYIDDANYVTIADRKKDVIITGGENVSSIEVEDAIFQHEDVTEVAVIGIPDEKWGELVTALVVKTAGLDTLRSRCHRLDESQARRLQVPEEGRVPRRARQDGHGQTAEVQAPRTVLAGLGPQRQLIAGVGNRTVNRAPFDGASSTPTTAPCATAMSRTIANPSPVPPSPELRAESSRTNRSNTRSRSATGIPGPSSDTVISTSPSGSSATVTMTRADA